MSLKIFVPTDTTAIALGADRVAKALVELAQQAGLNIELVRNGSRGAFWLEPLVEVEQGDNRLLFGPIQTGDVPSLVAALADDPAAHSRYLGSIADIPWLANQERVTFARAGLGDPVCLETYQSLDGMRGLQAALTMTPQAIVDQVKTSGLRGRGGAAFPTGIKWQTVLDQEVAEKYIVCNADEGDSGTFADRLLMESDPLQLIEGMIIAGLAVGAEQGYIYLRSEYPRALNTLNRAIDVARQANWLGQGIQDSKYNFELEVRPGAGAYICGEETSLLDSLEGKRGMVRAKPPLPAIEGLFGKPTVVNNVLTLAAVSSILAEGGEDYASRGVDRSRGTLVAQLAGNVERGGLVEIPYGISLRRLVEEYGGGTRSGRAIRAIQVGGPLGAYLAESQWDTAMDYEAFAATGAMLGHGGVVLFDDSVDMATQARFAMEFCAEESCGKCTPCRLGSTRGVEVIDRIVANNDRDKNLIVLKDLCDTMEDASLCAMGGLTPMPVRSALKHFAEDFGRPMAGDG